MLLLGPLVLALAPAAVNLIGEQPCPDRAAIEAELGRISPSITSQDSAARRLALIELERRTPRRFVGLPAPIRDFRHAFC